MAGTCRASWQWCMLKATRSQMAPIIAIQAGSKCVSGLRKKDTITHPSTVPHLRGQNRLSGVGGKFARESEGENKKGGRMVGRG